MIRVNGNAHAWRAGMTVADLLEALEDTHHYAVVRINDRHISRPNFDKAVIPDESDVFLIPMVAGG
ncbi:MAG: sulfur carrier protein ThiS [Proteobacteria bacterium]|nr:sulfur carrier protein ThiS [Pseudomonadota bacterium]